MRWFGLMAKAYGSCAVIGADQSELAQTSERGTLLEPLVRLVMNRIPVEVAGDHHASRLEQVRARVEPAEEGLYARRRGPAPDCQQVESHRAVNAHGINAVGQFGSVRSSVKGPVALTCVAAHAG